jgi:Asp-tRNA(Asn)/Glu-tRNA(Gln) amidotransferase A subunit family amidase
MGTRGRLRHKLIQDMRVLMKTVDVFVPTNDDQDTLFCSNQTGQSCVAVPNGGGTSLSFVGKLYDEARILALAKAYQDATGFHTNRPPLFVQ